jgi:hypothetical protein
MPKQYLVFLSHATSNAGDARRIKSDIERQGATVFLAADSVEKGELFENAIKFKLEACDEFWVLVTYTTIRVIQGVVEVGNRFTGSLDRPYVWVEIGIAWASRKKQVALLKGLTAREFWCDPDIPVFLKAMNPVDIENDFSGYETLLAELKRRVESFRGPLEMPAAGGGGGVP